MIPKILHYCWFGGNVLPDSVIKLKKTWKKYCPESKSGMKPILMFEKMYIAKKRMKLISGHSFLIM